MLPKRGRFAAVLLLCALLLTSCADRYIARNIDAPVATDSPVEPEPSPLDVTDAPEEPEITEAPEPELPSTEPETEPPSAEPEVPPVEPKNEYSIQPFAAPAANERVVTTHAELQNALENDNGVNTVYFGKNIALTGAIHIHNSKTGVLISGINPYDAEQTAPFTLTEYNLSSTTGNLYVNSSAVREVTVSDMTIVGRSIYGPVVVSNSATMESLVITYHRVTYSGPQMCYHRYGTVRFDSCDLTLKTSDTGVAPQEFSEVKHLIFEGGTRLMVPVSSVSVFWHPSGGTFTVADDATFTLTCVENSPYALFYADGSLNKVEFTVGKRAKADFSIMNSVAPTANVTLSAFTVKESGSFKLRTSAATIANPVLPVGGNLTVAQNAVFDIDAHGGSIYSAVDMRGGGTLSVAENATFRVAFRNTGDMLLRLNGGTFVCTDPRRVVLRNPGDRCIQADSTSAVVDIKAAQINYWNTDAPDAIGSAPKNRWTKADGSLMSVKGTLPSGANANFPSVTSNHTDGDPGVPPSASDFIMDTARILSFGRLDLQVDAPLTGTETISGETEPGATVRVTFTQDGEDFAPPDTISNADGSFTVNTGVPLISAVVRVNAYRDRLYAEKTVAVEDPGSLTISAPEELRFFATPISTEPQIVERLEPWNISLRDTRGVTGTWQLFVSAPQPLTPINADVPPLNGALVFVNADGTVTPLGAGGVPVYEHAASGSDEHVNVAWARDRGILVRAEPFTAHPGVTYSAVLEWSVVVAP